MIDKKMPQLVRNCLYGFSDIGINVVVVVAVFVFVAAVVVVCAVSVVVEFAASSL